jgi:hypothetical protein
MGYRSELASGRRDVMTSASFVFCKSATRRTTGTVARTAKSSTHTKSNRQEEKNMHCKSEVGFPRKPWLAIGCPRS